MWSDVLRLAGCGYRARLPSNGIFCLAPQHKSELKVFLNFLKKRIRAEPVGAFYFVCGKQYFHEDRAWKTCLDCCQGDVSFSGVRLQSFSPNQQH